MPSADLVAARQHPSASQRHNSAPIRCVTRKYWPIQTAPISTCHKFSSSSSFFFQGNFPLIFHLTKKIRRNGCRLRRENKQKADAGLQIYGAFHVTEVLLIVRLVAVLVLLSSRAHLAFCMDRWQLCTLSLAKQRRNETRVGGRERRSGQGEGEQGGPSDASL